jgi:hypothetical protein
MKVFKNFNAKNKWTYINTTTVECLVQYLNVCVERVKFYMKCKGLTVVNTETVSF